MIIAKHFPEENSSLSTECSNSKVPSTKKWKYFISEDVLEKDIDYFEEKLFNEKINYNTNSSLYIVEPSDSQEETEKCDKMTSCLSLVVMLMFSIFLCYADRIIMPSCIKSISEEFKFNKSDQGFILGLFYAGYIWTQILGGYMADTSRLGGKGVLFIGVFFWSLCMIGTSIIAYLGIIGFIIFRISLGIGEGVSFPAVNSIVGHHIPTKYSSTVISIIIASSYIGGGFAAFVTPPMIQKMGWRGPFYIFGIIGVFWSVIWLFLDVETLSWSRKPRIFGSYTRNKFKSEVDNIIVLRDSNESDFNRNITEKIRTGNFLEIETGVGDNSLQNENFEDSLVTKNYSNQNQKLTLDKKFVKYSENKKKKFNIHLILNLIKNKSIFAIIVAQYCHGWTQFGFVTWMPIYYSDVNHVYATSLGYYTTPPWVLQAIFIVIFGYLADRLVSSSTFRPIIVRKLFQSLSMFFGSISQVILIILNHTDLTSPSYTLIVICIMFISNTMSCGGVTVYQFDIAPTFPAVVYAIGNTFGTIAGLFSVSLTGLILNRSEVDLESIDRSLDEKDILERWKIVLLIYAIHNLIGGVVFILLGEDRPISLTEVKLTEYLNQVKVSNKDISVEELRAAEISH